MNLNPQSIRLLTLNAIIRKQLIAMPEPIKRNKRQQNAHKEMFHLMLDVTDEACSINNQDDLYPMF